MSGRGEVSISGSVAPVAASLVLGPILRHVSPQTATIWVEVSEPCTVEVLGHVATTFRVEGRSYGLVIVEGLEPGGTIPYEVSLDGNVVWPDQGTIGPSLLRTNSHDGDVSILAGSCRAAAPHEEPYTLDLMLDGEARGVDAMWAHSQRMKDEEPSRWPNLLLLMGDQIYADDSSPLVRSRIEKRRSENSDLPPEIVATFDEYCWLYHEAWSLPSERWLLSVVPSVMIFDDHDMIDDWNISESWVSDIRAEPWWQEHAIGGMMSYWIYQHLGNLSPSQIREEGMLARLTAVDDGTQILRDWAMESETFTPVPGGYRFSYFRDVGDVRIIVIDCRNGRVLEHGARQMVDDGEWAWICERAMEADGHVVLTTSVPVFIPDGIHDLQVWNEHVVDGAWGRWAARRGEAIRRELDLEDWSAFGDSFTAFRTLIDDLRKRKDPPRSITIASGDIHFSFAATVPQDSHVGPNVWQVVSSPIRNSLIPHERGVIRFTLTRIGRAIGAGLRRAARAPDTRPHIGMEVGPFFANGMAEMVFGEDGIELVFEQSLPGDRDETMKLVEVARLKLE